MSKVLMLATTAAMIEQFNKNNILILEKMGYEVHVAGNFLEGNPISEERLEEFKQWLSEHHGKWFHMPSTRKPTDLNNFRAYKQVVGMIKENHYEFIHCHTPLGSVIARCAAKKTHTKVMYTAHGFHFYDGAPAKNWMLYYSVEKFLSKWTDKLVLINHEDYERATKKFKAKETIYLPGIGIDLKKFSHNSVDCSKKRQELSLSENDCMFLSVGELIVRKNFDSLIKAVAKVNRKDVKFYICGKGPEEEHLISLIKENHLEEQVKLLGYRKDISELCSATDYYIFPSHQEGLSVALMEAIAEKIPVTCSKIRGNVDLIKDSRYLFDPKDVSDMADKILFLLENDHKKTIDDNYENLLKYDEVNVNEAMTKIYEEMRISIHKD